MRSENGAVGCAKGHEEERSQGRRKELWSEQQEEWSRRGPTKGLSCFSPFELEFYRVNFLKKSSLIQRRAGRRLQGREWAGGTLREHEGSCLLECSQRGVSGQSRGPWGLLNGVRQSHSGGAQAQTSVRLFLCDILILRYQLLGMCGCSFGDLSGVKINQSYYLWHAWMSQAPDQALSVTLSA